MESCRCVQQSNHVIVFLCLCSVNNRPVASLIVYISYGHSVAAVMCADFGRYVAFVYVCVCLSGCVYM